MLPHVRPKAAQPQQPRPLVGRFANVLVGYVTGDPLGSSSYGRAVASTGIASTQFGAGAGGRYIRPGLLAQKYVSPVVLPTAPAEATLVSIQRVASDSSSLSGWHHVQGTADNSHFLYLGGWYTSSLAAGRWLNGAVPAGDVTRPHVAICTARTNDHRAYCNGEIAGSSTSAGAVNMTVCDLWGTSSPSGPGFDGEGYGVFVFPFALTEAEALYISSSPEAAWGAMFGPQTRRLWAVSAGGSHATDGALSADAATVAGTAAHLTLHATSGALSADAATVAGTATHLTLHTTTGALAADAATVAGAAVHPHTTTGALSADAATVAGTAAHLTLHTTTGALAADAAAVAGSAAHTVPGASHDTDGALSADAATVAGTATHLTLHTTTGALVADAATVSGAAVHGSGTTISVVQPYITVYFWKRAA